MEQNFAYKRILNHCGQVAIPAYLPHPKKEKPVLGQARWSSVAKLILRGQGSVLKRDVNVTGHSFSKKENDGS